MFKDPASVYSYSLILVHHQVMWYMIIILSVVYWTYYRIIHDFQWNKNRRINPYHWRMELLFFENSLLMTRIWLRQITKRSNNLIKSYLEAKKQSTAYNAWASLGAALQIANSSRLMDISAEEWLEAGGENLLLKKYFDKNTTKGYRSMEEVLEVEKFKENLLLEYIWAIFPSMVIILILIPSLYLLYSLEENMDPKYTIKVIGHQWFWSYEFHNGALGISFEYESNLVPEQDLEEGAKRLLEVDNKVYLPVNVPVRILVTSSDVLHSWAVPELGIKVDAVPGRLNDAITLIRRPGVFYGQCSELCGVGHGFMPIAVESSSYKNWVKKISSL